MVRAPRGRYHRAMQYYAGKSSARDGYRSRPVGRRVRYNPATGWYELIGTGTPPVAFRTRGEAESHLPE